tara:strand:- start:14660 stop:14905 length:246 start_codon:yes stop_codon:yes gene_type:complete
MKYIIYFKYKDDDGKPNEGPLDTYDSHMEAVAFRDGYMQAILNHTGNAKQSEVMSLLEIKRIDETIVNKHVVNNKNKKKEQ